MNGPPVLLLTICAWAITTYLVLVVIALFVGVVALVRMIFND